jgi:2-oxoglutarate/2-oxoacid ferredoxin oxidoreductase subunit alpha
MVFDLNILIGGEAGQGIQTIGFVLGKAMNRGGLHVFADQNYESRIRGGHNFFRVRVKDSDLSGLSEELDILVALNKQTIDIHRPELNKNGLIIADTKIINIDSNEKDIFDVPFEKLAMESSSNKLMSNSVALGAIAGLLNYDFDILSEVLRWQFNKNPTRTQEENVAAAKAGYEYTKQRIPSGFKTCVKAIKNMKSMFLNGNESISLGAMAAGCKFLAAYPMTPITSILEYIADKGTYHNIAFVQPEDEISAINMVIGASYAGVRSMTVTSGSGFALMIEAVGLAGMAEIPAVIVLGQRPGPAVGLPTGTEQGELLFAINSGTGEFPRAVFAPANIQDAFYLTTKAFNLADKYQIPVIILTDTYLANSYNDTQKFDLNKVKIDRGELLSDEEAIKITDYKRYRDNPSGISARVLPIQSRNLVISDSDEHDESGHLNEKAQNRNQQVSKRLRKLNGLKTEIAQPIFKERDNAIITLIGWGSTFGAILEASELLQLEGISSNVLHITEIWPFPSEFVASVISKTKKNIVIECNATGQLASLILSETGIQLSGRINKWDGHPISPQYILKELKKGVL